jgi:hypothetical protein
MTFADQPGEHNGRTIPSNTAIRRPAGFVEGNCDLLKRDVSTVQRWEKREEMLVHRHLHDRIGSVYASRADLDAWMRGRNL